MKFFGSKRHEHAGEGQHLERKPSPDTDGRITALAVFLGLTASCGGFLFGYTRLVHSLFLKPLMVADMVGGCLSLVVRASSLCLQPYLPRSQLHAFYPL